MVTALIEIARCLPFAAPICFVGLFLLTGVAGARPELIDRIVAVVDREVILWSELNFRLDLYLQASGYNFIPPEQELNRLREELLNEMIDEQVVILKAKRDSVQIDLTQVEEMLQEQFGEVKNRMEADEFREMLARSGLTERQLRSRYRENIRNSLLIDQMRQLLAMRQNITRQDVESFRESHADTLPSTIFLSQIKLDVKPDSVAILDVHERIRTIQEKLDAGEAFETLARTYSEHAGSAVDGGYIGCFAAGLFDDQPRFEAAAFSLKPGEVSEPVLTDKGYHLIRVDEKREDEVCASHILLRASSTEKDEERVRDRLLELRDRALAGENFAELARLYSDDPTGESGGLWNVYDKNQIPVSLEPHLGHLPLGGISEPIFMNGGGRIIKINDDSATLERLIRETRMVETMQEVIDEFKQQLHVERRTGGIIAEE